MKNGWTKLALSLIALTLGGCATFQKLPPIAADSLDYKRTDSFGGTIITAKDIKKAADGTITAGSVTWNTTYPLFSVTLTVTGYKQDPVK